MILADKIINERKKCGWSQEELAEKLGVSRQSVSKWEGAQAVPDLQKILKMAELFNVTTDYLLKDEIEGEPAGGSFYEEDKDYSVRKVSMEEANAYLDTVKEASPKIALGVLLCIVSPILLILLAGGAEVNLISDRVATAIGLTGLFGCIVCAVFFFVVYGSKMDKFEYLEKEEFETTYGVDGMVKEKQSRTSELYNKLIVTAVLMCVVAPLPLIISAVLGASSMFIICMVCVLLAIIALAVYIFVSVGCVTDSYKILLKEKEFSKESKKADKVIGAIACAYWMVITAAFLAMGFLADAWAKSWVIWPIAGVLFAGIMAIARAAVEKED